MTLFRTALVSILSVAASGAAAANLALVLTQAGDDTGLGFLHGEIAAAYAEAGFEVHGGIDLNRADILAEVGKIEVVFDTADHVVIHLTGGLREASGLTVFVPSDVAGDSLSSLLANAVPIPLMLDLPQRKPGAGVLALGWRGDSLPIPQSMDVLVLDGPPEAVADMVALRLLADGLVPSQLDAGTGVRVTGLVSDSFQLGREGSVGIPRVTPQLAEKALDLSLDDRADLQDGLASLGFDPLEAGGAFGSGTRQALSDWANARGRVATGYLSLESLAALQAEIEAVRSATASVAAERESWAAASANDTQDGYRAYLQSYPEGRFASRARDRLDTLEARAEAAARAAAHRDLELRLELTLSSIATLENRLSALGFTPGPADGRVEVSTRRSIAQFQAQTGLPPTGYFNPATIQRLLTAAN